MLSFEGIFYESRRIHDTSPEHINTLQLFKDESRNVPETCFCLIHMGILAEGQDKLYGFPQVVFASLT